MRGMDYKKHTLKNGLRVITAPMPQIKSVTVMIIVGVGSRYEEREHQGVAHLIEHMMFKGTRKRPTPLAIAAELDGIGADFNAFTSHELTGFYVKAASEQLPLALDVLVDILLNSKFEEEDLEQERRIVLEERRMYRDDPKDHVWELYGKIAFGDHPLGWPIVGQEETIKAISRQHLHQYCKRWYKPGNIVVALAGAISEYRAVAEVRRLLGGLKRAEWSKPLPFKGTQQKPQVLVETRKTDQTHIILGVRGYPLDHPKKYAYTVLDTILGTGMSSRLFTQLREKRGLAYYVGSLALPYTDAGTLIAYGGVNNRRVEEASEAILGEFRKLKIRLVASKELTKAKEMLKGRLALSLESSNYIARFLVGQEMLKGKIETSEELMKKIDAVTAEEARNVARELFVNKTLNLALIGPMKDGERFLSLLDLS